ncbi:hypothetical protein C1X65_03390 [Pseudomonas sp. FW305-70]|nr:hypothetical protein C1X65_03390 [Pseudomonas sp. FW305-70]
MASELARAGLRSSPKNLSARSFRQSMFLGPATAAQPSGSKLPRHKRARHHQLLLKSQQSFHESALFPLAQDPYLCPHQTALAKQEGFKDVQPYGYCQRFRFVLFVPVATGDGGRIADFRRT